MCTRHCVGGRKGKTGLGGLRIRMRLKFHPDRAARARHPLQGHTKHPFYYKECTHNILALFASRTANSLKITAKHLASTFPYILRIVGSKCDCTCVFVRIGGDAGCVFVEELFSAQTMRIEEAYYTLKLGDCVGKAISVHSSHRLVHFIVVFLRICPTISPPAAQN